MPCHNTSLEAFSVLFHPDSLYIYIRSIVQIRAVLLCLTEMKAIWKICRGCDGERSPFSLDYCPFRNIPFAFWLNIRRQLTRIAVWFVCLWSMNLFFSHNCCSLLCNIEVVSMSGFYYSQMGILLLPSLLNDLTTPPSNQTVPTCHGMHCPAGLNTLEWSTWFSYFVFLPKTVCTVMYAFRQ